MKKGKVMQEVFEGVKNKFGFGCMRLPMQDENVDMEQFQKMVDLFLENGFNYFDTAHGYLGEKSETVIREGLVKRYPRERFILADKLSSNYFEKQEEIRPLFESQLKACGVEYFDYYLMHAQSADKFAKYKKCRAYETALELKKERKIRHLGISFHDKAAVLEQILTEYPQIETVQIQFNYLDYDSPKVESRKCYEICRRFGKPVIVMEPVKGGKLAQLPAEAKEIFEKLQGGSPASYALRFAAGHEGVRMVLSGMGSLGQMKENIDVMKECAPLDEKELAAVKQVVGIFKEQELIACTDCRYCIDGCPQQIAIPALFACMNAKKQQKTVNTDLDYRNLHTNGHGRASDCMKCGKCEAICPQQLPIRELLVKVADVFEK